MIDALISWSLRNRAAVLVMAALLLVIGGYTALKMPVDVFPDLTAPTVTVITEAKGMAPAEVESQVTFPIEAAVNGASGVRRVRSATAVGLSIVWIEFDWGTDIYAARQIVSEKVNVAASELPPEVDRPVLAPVSSIMGEILFIALTSDKHTPIELRTTADTVIRRRVLSVPGVSQVTPIGGGVKQFQVLLSPAKLQAHGLALGHRGPSGRDVRTARSGARRAGRRRSCQRNRGGTPYRPRLCRRRGKGRRGQLVRLRHCRPAPRRSLPFPPLAPYLLAGWCRSG